MYDINAENCRQTVAVALNFMRVMLCEDSLMEGDELRLKIIEECGLMILCHERTKQCVYITPKQENEFVLDCCANKEVHVEICFGLNSLRISGMIDKSMAYRIMCNYIQYENLMKEDARIVETLMAQILDAGIPCTCSITVTTE